MQVERNIWVQSLSTTTAPRWPCPSCNEGRLHLKRDTLFHEETAESQRSRDHEDFHPMEMSFCFSAILECRHCREKISCCGLGGYEQVYIQDEEGDADVDYVKRFSPRYLSEPMKILKIPTRCPRTVKDALQRSFSLFFCDLSGAANHARQCVEFILSHAGINAQGPRGGFIPLATRIEEFRRLDRDNAERANALKWIGNFGSHGETLRKDDLFDAYDILDVLIEDLYVGHQRSVREIVAQINSNRGPRR